MFVKYLRTSWNRSSQMSNIFTGYDEMGNLMIKLLPRIINKSKIQTLHVTNLPDVDLSRSNQLQDSEISIGGGTRKYLKKCSEWEQKKCLLGMWSAFGAIAFYLQRKLTFRNKLLASLWCLNPQKIAASKPSNIIMIAKKLFVSDDNIVKVTDEWKVFSMDQSIHSISYKRVDHIYI